MQVARFGFALASAAALLGGCGPAIPPAGDYATVSGVVTDSVSGAPIAGASVKIDVVFSATTDANGSFRIANVPNGPWEYSVEAQNYDASASDQLDPLAPGEARALPVALVHQ
jgi:hypothetical protein